ncbi:unnamed protein product [Candida verbasci]|uniref:Vacuolar sorting protein Vps3844 C-terminal domain-containing protein n=1 Tax=Candida verbasci TaxID=1227364 RepID=A0A9W4TZJ6_9ASCO|nr:unnamed protein product [Candida verbasci]
MRFINILPYFILIISVYCSTYVSIPIISELPQLARFSNYDAITFLQSYLKLDTTNRFLNDSLIEDLDSLSENKFMSNPYVILNLKTEGPKTNFDKYLIETDQIKMRQLFHKLQKEKGLIEYSNDDSVSLFTKNLPAPHLKEYLKSELSGNDIKVHIAELTKLRNRFTSNDVLQLSLDIDSDADLFEEYMRVLSPDYNIIIINDVQDKKVIHTFERSKRSTSLKSFQFESKESCESNTNNCNSHGACSETKGAWQCVCKSTYNEDAKKTTHWVGPTCAKIDVSTEANLFLWTSIFLLVLLVGGIKVLVSIGNDPLPGVLDAATISKKSI